MRSLRLAAGLRMRLDPDASIDRTGLQHALRTPGTWHWSGVEVGDWEAVDEYLPLALSEPGVGLLVTTTDLPVDDGTVDPAVRSGAPCLAVDDSLAYRVFRRSDRRPGHQELGVVAHGPRGYEVAARLIYLLLRWSTQRHPHPHPHLEVWPAATPDHLLPPGRVIDKSHTRVVVSWSGRLT